MADGEQKVEMENQIYPIPENLLKGSGVEVKHTPFLIMNHNCHWVAKIENMGGGRWR